VGGSCSTPEVKGNVVLNCAVIFKGRDYLGGPDLDERVAQ
jgi:hypothetical protein